MIDSLRRVEVRWVTKRVVVGELAAGRREPLIAKQRIDGR